MSPSNQSDFRFGPQTVYPPPRHLSAVALYGLVGRIVAVMGPQTEAAIVALVLTLLAMFGNVIGRSAHYLIGGTEHFTNLFVALVGPTAAGRKGTALRAIMLLFQRIDPEWCRNRLRSGLSSGEGIIWAVRDPVWERRATRDALGAARTTDTLVDAGEEDKRLFVVEEELATALKAFDRQGNTLSPVLRRAWDAATLGTLTKTPVTATDPLPTVLGHIGKPEVLRSFSTTEAANGLGNRFLWGWTRRSRSLPHGGSIRDEDLQPLIEDLASSVAFARQVGRMTRSSTADEIWEREYTRLSAEMPGLYGCMVARAAPQVLRLSMIYALLDHCEIILPEHLLAALELWRYCDDSVKFIFGGRLGDPTADRVLEALRASRDHGLTRSEISELFSRNKPLQEIECALQVLADSGLATWQNEATEGRPVQRWFSTDSPSTTTGDQDAT